MSHRQISVPKSFENEATWARAVEARKEDEFHSAYDRAIKRIRSEFGKTYPNIINGNEVYADSTFKDVSPANTSEVLGVFQNGSKKDVEIAVAAAYEAFASWCAIPYKERIRLFGKTADIVSKNKFEFAALVSFDNGKNRFEAMGDVDESIDLMRYYSSLMEENEGYTRVMSKTGPSEAVKSVLRPYGVWGVIAPFNFVALTVGMSTGALLTGNTVIYKPATDTPWMGFRFCQYLAEAGLPKGAMNYISGPGGVVGNALVEDNLVQGIVFTGSRDVGVASHAAFTSKDPRPFIAEMGGKNAAIVTKNADLKKAAAGVASGAFGYSGQKCSATSRVYVDKKVKAQFEKLLVDATKNLKVDDPTRRDSFVTPLINSNAYQKFIDFAELGRKDGRVIFGGRAVKSGDYAKGYFVEPTIVTDLPKDHPILTEELFVPLLAVASTDSLDEAIQEANKSKYGLTAGIFSKDRKEVTHFFDRIEAGTVYANRKSSATTGAVTGTQPFVGWKYSGSSGKGAGGPYYLLSFLHEQTQTIVK